MHQAGDLERSSTTSRQDSGHWVGRASSSPPLYRREGPAPRGGGAWGRPRIPSTGALPARAAPGTAPFFESASLYIPRQCCLNNLDLLSGKDRVGRVDNNPIVGLEAGDDLDLISKIVPRGYGREHDFPIFDNADT